MTEFYTVGDASKRLELSADQVRRLEREGKLPAIRVGRNQRLFQVRDVEILRSQRQKKK